MSVANHIFIEQQQLPSSSQWLEAIKQYGFDMDMDVKFDTLKHEGFLACRYQGLEAGFEYWTEEINFQELLEDGQLTQEEVKQLGQRNFMVTLTTRSNFREYMTSMIASAVLCSISDGKLAEDGTPPFIASFDAVKWAKECEPEVQKEI
jgi:hypothetical protein